MKRLVLRLRVAAALATIATQPWRRDSLDPSDGWRAVDPADPSATGVRFFRVSVGATNATSSAPGP